MACNEKIKPLYSLTQIGILLLIAIHWLGVFVGLVGGVIRITAVRVGRQGMLLLSQKGKYPSFLGILLEMSWWVRRK